MFSRRFHGDQSNDGISNLCVKLCQLKMQIQTERIISIREKLNENRRKVEFDVSQFSLRASRKNLLFLVDNGFSTMPLCKYSGFPQGLGDDDSDVFHDVELLPSTQLPFVEKIPRYVTWAFVNRNQRLFEDQAVVGSIHAYGQGQRKKEALICGGNEEDNEEPEEEKHEFIEGEDRILWTILQEHGLGDQVLNIVSQFIGVAISDIKDRYSRLLKEKCHDKSCEASGSGDSGSHEQGISLETTLGAALDTFDSLFCRRCLIFDCRLHGCPPTLIVASEKQPVWSGSEDNRKPCSDHCYLQLRADQDVVGGSTVNVPQRDIGTDLIVLDDHQRCNSGKVPSVTSNAVFVSEVSTGGGPNAGTSSMQNKGKGKAVQQSTLVPYGIQHSSKKRKKPYPWDIIRSLTEYRPSPAAKSSHHVGASNALDPQRITKDSQSKSNEGRKLVPSSSEWKPIEKELYLKGVEIFGTNSCLIARNLLSGLKTCVEVFNYMRASGSSFPQNSVSKENGNANTDHTEQEIPKRRRLFRKRGKARKLKYTYRKSTSQPSMRKKAADDKTMLRKHYKPCGCGTVCGKQCPCLQNETRCEKYCGCSKSCKNRFRGCHCAKKQCRTKQCPCFAATRECDPDICRNCWVSCGDGTLGEPPKRGHSQCGNMKLLLRQRQRILLSRSEVAGWGAFLQNSVNKDDYLGEYVGEMVCYPEADERGTTEKCGPTSTFLFDLDNQYVLDAHRIGNKLKFANHSATPNCYAQGMLVAGDHRVGIYAKEHIEAGEEIFFDYMIGPEQAPPWARKPEDSKGDSSSAAKKPQSH